MFLTPTGGVKILDFGLARDTSVQGGLTGQESPTTAPATTPVPVLGTVGYMAPEQVRRVSPPITGPTFSRWAACSTHRRARLQARDRSRDDVGDSA